MSDILGVDSVEEINNFLDKITVEELTCNHVWSIPLFSPILKETYIPGNLLVIASWVRVCSKCEKEERIFKKNFQTD